MKFKSIPVFWCSQNLADPQSLNAYSYANNNPITLSDPRGKFFETAFDLAMLGYSLYQLYEHPSWENAGAAGLDALGTAIPFVPAGGGLLVRTTKTAKKLADGAETSGKTYQIYGKVSTKADEVYIGRTSGKKAPEINVKTRDANHHKTSDGFGEAKLLITTKTYEAARGLEQIAQDYTQSLGKITDQIRGISLSNPNLKKYLDAAQKQITEIQNAINKLISGK